MPTLVPLVSEQAMQLPESFRKVENPETSNRIFIQRKNSEASNYQKSIIGREYLKETSVLQVEDETVFFEKEQKLQKIHAYAYVSNENPTICFLTGPGAEKVLSVINKAAPEVNTSFEKLDLARLEKSTFSSGEMTIFGHKYGLANNTIKVNAEKTDGAPFRENDPDFISCDETEKVSLNL